MGHKVKVKKLNAINFIGSLQIDYCLASQKVQFLANLLYTGPMADPKNVVETHFFNRHTGKKS